jgi:hypothetical protein
MTTKYLLILDEEGQEQTFIYDNVGEANDAFTLAEERPDVFSAALFATNPPRKLLRHFERD